MAHGDTRRFVLARSAAVFVVGGLAAGCSSGAASLTDGLVTNSTSSSAPMVVAQADQAYPGDVQGRRAQPGYDRVLRPKVPVGGQVIGGDTPPQAFPAPTVAAPAPVYSAPSVSSAPLPPPQNAQGQSATAPAAPQQAGGTQQLSAPPKAQASFSGGSYTVVSGDTLYGVARKTGASAQSIRQANGLSDDGMIRIGQKLVIPSGGTVASAAKPAAKTTDPVTTSAAASTSAPAKTPEPAKVTAYTPPTSTEKASKEEADTVDVAALPPDSTGVGRLRWPVRGRVVSGFGASEGGKANDGIDIAVPEGTSVRAAENGVVIYSGDGLKGFGNTVLVRHEDGLVTVYGHASDIKVKRGDNVKRGQEIAVSGMSGDADRPKLHFEVRKGTNPVDPTTYLE